ILEAVTHPELPSRLIDLLLALRSMQRDECGAVRVVCTARRGEAGRYCVRAEVALEHHAEVHGPSLSGLRMEVGERRGVDLVALERGRQTEMPLIAHAPLGADADRAHVALVAVGRVGRIPLGAAAEHSGPAALTFRREARFAVVHFAAEQRLAELQA